VISAQPIVTARVAVNGTSPGVRSLQRFIAGFPEFADPPTGSLSQAPITGNRAPAPPRAQCGRATD
jgi:hypothetical protein